MNTFAVLLLAFPFYLAIQGRLIAYTNLVVPQASAPTAANPPASQVTPIPSVS